MENVLARRLWAKSKSSDKERGLAEVIGGIAINWRYFELVRSIVEPQIRRGRLSQMFLGLSGNSVFTITYEVCTSNVPTQLSQADETMTKSSIQAEGKNYLVCMLCTPRVQRDQANWLACLRVGLMRQKSLGSLCLQSRRET